MWRIKFLIRKIITFPARIKKAWPYNCITEPIYHTIYKISFATVLSLQLKQITKEIIKFKHCNNRRQTLKLLWECRRALKTYLSDKAEETSYEIDNSLFKKKFTIDIPDVIISRNNDNSVKITYQYPNTIDEKTIEQMDEYLHSEERRQAIKNNFNSLNTAYLQDFLNKLGVVIDSFEY